MSRILDVNDYRLCNFAWCYLRMIYSRKSTQSQSSFNNFINEIPNFLCGPTLNHIERLSQIENLLEHNNWSDSSVRFVRSIAAVLYNEILKGDEIKNIDKVDAVWLWNYIDNKFTLNVEHVIMPMSKDEILKSALAMIDIQRHFFSTHYKQNATAINKTISQKIYREQEDDCLVKIGKSELEKLDEISSKTNLTRRKILNSLISSEHKKNTLQNKN